MNKRETGSCYEELAAVCLQKKGYRIIERNYRCRQGEVEDVYKRQADGLGELEEILDSYAAEAERLFCKRDRISSEEDRTDVSEERQPAQEDLKCSGLGIPLPGLGEPAPRIRRRAMSEVKLSLIHI